MVLSLSLERKMIKMIKADERAEIPPLNAGTIAAALVQAMHTAAEDSSLSTFEFIFKI